MVKHIGFFEVEGFFREGSGKLVFMPGSPDSVAATIFASVELHVASVDTDNSLRDKELVSDDFLDARRYPTIFFTSTHAIPDGLTSNGYILSGIMGIYGVRREITIPLRLVHDPELRIVTITSDFVVHRHDYEMDFGRASDGLIGEEVKVQVLIVAREVAATGNRP